MKDFVYTLVMVFTPLVAYALYVHDKKKSREEKMLSRMKEQIEEQEKEILDMRAEIAAIERLKLLDASKRVIGRIEEELEEEELEDREEERKAVFELMKVLNPFQKRRAIEIGSSAVYNGIQHHPHQLMEYLSGVSIERLNSNLRWVVARKPSFHPDNDYRVIEVRFPHWAFVPANMKYLAMSSNGIWYFFEEEPKRSDNHGIWISTFQEQVNMTIYPMPSVHNWRSSLIRRPE